MTVQCSKGFLPFLGVAEKDLELSGWENGNIPSCSTCGKPAVFAVIASDGSHLGDQCLSCSCSEIGGACLVEMK